MRPRFVPCPLCEIKWAPIVHNACTGCYRDLNPDEPVHVLPLHRDPHYHSHRAYCPQCHDELADTILKEFLHHRLRE